MSNNAQAPATPNLGQDGQYPVTPPSVPVGGWPATPGTPRTPTGQSTPQYGVNGVPPPAPSRRRPRTLSYYNSPEDAPDEPGARNVRSRLS